MTLRKEHMLVPPVMTKDGRCLTFAEMALDYLNLELRRSTRIVPEVLNAHSALTLALESDNATLIADCRTMLVDALRSIGKLDDGP